MTPAQVRKAETEISNLTDAIAGGLLRSSPALAERLYAAEAELARLRDIQAATTPAQSVEKVLTGVEVQFRRIREGFERALCDRHGERGGQELRGLIGRINVEADEREIRFYNEQGRIEAALSKCIGADARNCGSGGRI